MDHRSPSSFAALFDLVGELARLRLQAGERAFATLGLNHTEARLLSLLQGHGGEASQDVLSGMLTIDRSNAGRALKSLEGKGCVARRAGKEDARTRAVRITAKGRRTAAQIAKLRSKMAEGFFGDLPDDQAAVIVGLLQSAMGLGGGR
ncbi:MAG: MarR family transcriptional regulator [Fimbriimonadaceae bacterium]|nr:MarR family transcriptional regulator [Fimbriimonadaceae bacterium]